MEEIKAIVIGLTGIALIGGGCYLAGARDGYAKGWNDCSDMVQERLSKVKEKIGVIRGRYEEVKKEYMEKMGYDAE